MLGNYEEVKEFFSIKFYIYCLDVFENRLGKLKYFLIFDKGSSILFSFFYISVYYQFIYIFVFGLFFVGNISYNLKMVQLRIELMLSFYVKSYGLLDSQYLIQDCFGQEGYGFSYYKKGD